MLNRFCKNPSNKKAIVFYSAYRASGIKMGTLSDSGIWTSLTVPGTITQSTFEDQFCWSKKINGKWYLATIVGTYYGGPYYYEYDGNTFTSMTVNATIDTTKASWSSDATKLVIAIYNASPWLTIFTRSGTALTQGTLSGAALAAQHTQVFFTTDTTVIGLTNGAGIGVYTVSGSTISYTTAPTTNTTNCISGDVTTDKAYLAVTASVSPYLRIYSISGTTLTSVATVSGLTNNLAGAKWSPDGTKLAVTFTSSPYIAIYDWNSSTNTLTARTLTYTSTLYGPWSSGSKETLVWSPNSKYLWHGMTSFIGGEPGFLIWDVSGSGASQKSVDLSENVIVSAGAGYP